MSGLTDAERDALGPFIWGGWIGVAEGREAEFSRDLFALVARIKADAYQRGRVDLATKVEALTPMVLDEWPLAGEWLSRVDVLTILAADATPVEARP